MKLINISTLCLLVIAASLGIAQELTIKQVPIKYVDPSSGKDMYVAYCAACHGEDGMGLGPAATALKVPPTDLTMLARRNKSTYPASDVYQIIVGSGTTLIPAHGSAEMPVWGPLFASLSTGSTPNGVAMRAGNIVDYLKGIQR
jgi:mono/diheme cytochrome c family protein